MSADTYLDETVGIARAWDDARDRSTQTEVGMSELGGCRAAIGYRLRGTWESDDTDNWRAIAGTIMHDGLTEIRRKANPGLMFDVHVTYRGTGGHPDEVDPARNRVAEWKFPRLSTSILWQGDADAFLPKRLQGHGYAAGLIDAGILTEDCTVVVCVMPVDGTFDDWWTHEEPFDRAVADAAADRLDEVKKRMANDELLPRDKPYGWCEQFCDFFTLCRGRTGPRDDEPIVDAEVASAVRQYGETLALIGPLDRRKKELAKEIRGIRGIVGDPAAGPAWKVSMTSPSGTKQVTDLERVEAEYQQRIGPLPTREVPTSSPSLRVVPVKPPAAKKKTTTPISKGAPE